MTRDEAVRFFLFNPLGPFPPETDEHIGQLFGESDRRNVAHVVNIKTAGVGETGEGGGKGGESGET